MTNDTNELQELRARVDRLEKLVDRLGCWVHTDQQYVHRHLGWAPQSDPGYFNTYRIEFMVLSPGDASFGWEALTELWDDPDGGPSRVVCGCGWGEDVTSVEQARELAAEHSEKAHGELVAAYPELAGPAITQAVEA